jgi:DHA3 family macrolide efflux protein-like MFS transporter
MPFFNAPTTTLLQEMVRPDMQGRVFGVMQLIMTTVMPLGMLVFGPIADFISIEVLLILSSVLMAIPGIWIFFKNQPVNTQPGLGAQDFEMRTGD